MLFPEEDSPDCVQRSLSTAEQDYGAMYTRQADFLLAHLSTNPDDYFAKGTTEHLTFLRVMREAHQQFPFRNKKDTDLIENALEIVFQQLPMLRQRAVQTQHIFYMNTMFRIAKQRKRKPKE